MQLYVINVCLVVMYPSPLHTHTRTRAQIHRRKKKALYTIEIRYKAKMSRMLKTRKSTDTPKIKKQFSLREISSPK